MLIVRCVASATMPYVSGKPHSPVAWTSTLMDWRLSLILCAVGAGAGQHVLRAFKIGTSVGPVIGICSYEASISRGDSCGGVSH